MRMFVRRLQVAGPLSSCVLKRCSLQQMEFGRFVELRMLSSCVVLAANAQVGVPAQLGRDKGGITTPTKRH